MKKDLSIITAFNLILLFQVVSVFFSFSQSDGQIYQTAEIEQRIDSLLNKMSIEQKIGQLALRGTSSSQQGSLPDKLIDDVRAGRIGAFLNVMDTSDQRILQEASVYHSEHGIPLIFARDVIHGFKTIFPIPLGLAATWNPVLIEESSRIAAIEATSAGIRWTFAPMLDICRDSRWGRIAESPGEDPYLASQISASYVRGFQGNDFSDPTTMAACAKHFIGYGAAIGGRDYNTAIISDEELYNIYLPPFRDAVSSDVATFMSSFNEVNGIPVSGSKKMLTDILRKNIGFDGFVVSDWNSVTEMIAHGFAGDERHAAQLSANAGLNMEMTSSSYEIFLLDLINDGLVPQSQLDALVRDILRIKFKMGLFDMPFLPENHPGEFYAPQHLQKAKQAAVESTVLLKNDAVLPLDEDINILLTGPLAHQKHEQLGTWTFDGEAKYTVTPREALPNAHFVEGLTYSRDTSQASFEKIIEAAKRSDVVVFVGGEESILSGEAHSRANIKLPGAQENLIDRLSSLGKPLILVIMAGRPINITGYVEEMDAVLMMWHPGTMGGEALHDMLFGISEPGGRLPVSWPKAAGQLPYFYNHKNTGRPASPENFVSMDEIPIGAWQSSLGNESHYLDLGFAPLFPFGYGLGYSTVQYGEISFSDSTLSKSGQLKVSIELKNTGERTTKEVVQLYSRDPVGRVTRPVRELKRFKKVSLEPGEEQQVIFTLRYDDFMYYDNEGIQAVEPGEILLYIGKSASNTRQFSILIK